MKTLQILGTGCAKCEQLATAAQQAATQAGLEFQVEKITDFTRFAEFGVMITPALIVDGELKVAGKVPGVEALIKLIS